MTTQPIEGSDNMLLTRSPTLGNGADTGAWNAQPKVHPLQVRSFSAFIPIEMPHVPSRRRRSLWRRITSWFDSRR